VGIGAQVLFLHTLYYWYYILLEFLFVENLETGMGVRWTNVDKSRNSDSIDLHYAVSNIHEIFRTDKQDKANKYNPEANITTVKKKKCARIRISKDIRRTRQKAKYQKNI
jgi:hypothetical protein